MKFQLAQAKEIICQNLIERADKGLARLLRDRPAIVVIDPLVFLIALPNIPFIGCNGGLCRRRSVSGIRPIAERPADAMRHAITV